MDYSRIYRDFIADRRCREASLEGYRERHHIFPKSFGGDDSPENIIELSFEDHYFAHLLLAKAHGGKMASALWLMVSSAQCRWRDRHRARTAYALAELVASKVMSAAWLGDKNPLFNPEIFDWMDYRTGETKSATLHEIHIIIGGSRPHWTNVAKGDRPSYRGWILASNAASHSRSEKGKAFTFLNRDGRKFSGTQGVFAKLFGVNLATASRIVRRESVSECGWRLEGTQDRPANWAKDGLPSRKFRPVQVAI